MHLIIWKILSVGRKIYVSEMIAYGQTVDAVWKLAEGSCP